MKSFAIVLLLLPIGASAATITVNTTADNRRAHSGKCTLREAIANVNAAADTTVGDCASGSGTGDTIIFNLTVPATIRLRGGVALTIAKDTTIVGPGSDLLAIDGRKVTRVFHITAGTTTMSDLTIQRGRVSPPNASGRGGGILLDSGAVLDLSNCNVLGNKASGRSPRVRGFGGGIYIAGTATLTNCAVSGNITTSGHGKSGNGGGIFVASEGTASLSNCTISGNASGASHLANFNRVGGGGIENRGTATLADCTINGNTSGGVGGGMENSGTATLTDCTISGNTSDAGGVTGEPTFGNGGGIDNRGTATLTRCTLSSNTANAFGGGIDNTGTATLIDCTLSGNTSSGGGVYGGGGGVTNDGTASLTNCTISGNSANGVGGGMYNAGSATLTDCTFSDNQTSSPGGGVENRGTVTLTNCTISGNMAGGGAGVDNPTGSATLTNCTLSDNTAEGPGGGMGNAGTAFLTNCTVSGNTAGYGGGVITHGIINTAGTTHLTNCTISGNTARGFNIYSGGGIETFGSTNPGTLTNTIIALNQPNDCRTPPASDGHNLDGDGSCFTSGGTDLSNMNPVLAPLGNYGGPTQTLAVCTGLGVPNSSCTDASPAIDAGDDAVTGPPDNLSSDQRGLPRLSGVHVDIGAYEVQQ